MPERRNESSAAQHRSPSIAGILIYTFGGLGFIVGVALLVYSFQGDKTLSTEQAVAVLLVSLPVWIILALVVMLTEKVRDGLG